MLLIPAEQSFEILAPSHSGYLSRFLLFEASARVSNGSVIAADTLSLRVFFL
jgi:hypothetical protein